MANGVITFAWTANKSGNRPYPHVRVVRIDEENMDLINEPDIWSRDYAFAYPDLSPNRRGIVGISLLRGGGDVHLGHVVGVRDDDRSVWDLKATQNGTDGPADGKCGDYVDCAPYMGRGYLGNSWYASGFTLQGGGSRSNVEPRVVQFGFRRR